LPNESAGLLQPPEERVRRTKYPTMFAQGRAGTLAQHTCVFALIGHAGTYLPRRLLDRMECHGAPIPPAPDPGRRAAKDPRRVLGRGEDRNRPDPRCERKTQR